MGREKMTLMAIFQGGGGRKTDENVRRRMIGSSQEPRLLVRS
jgi:hypothetical protein